MISLFKYLSVKRVWHIFCIWLSNVLPLRGHHRYIITRWGGVNITGKCYIYKNVYFDSVAPHLITIGKNATITQGTTILTHYIDPDKVGRSYRMGEVHIEEDAFIGCNTIICNDVTIGKGSIVGAGSVVTKDIPPYQVWGGVPAKYIKDRTH